MSTTATIAATPAMSTPIEDTEWTPVVHKKTKKRENREAIKAERKFLQCLIDLKLCTPAVVARARALGMRVAVCSCAFAFFGKYVPSPMMGEVDVGGTRVAYCLQCLETDNSVEGVDIPGTRLYLDVVRRDFPGPVAFETEVDSELRM
eukprot:jgi/Tetstr1/463151/TSEL_008085.t1